MIITPINSTESAVHLSGYVSGVSGARDVWPIAAATTAIPIPEILRKISISSSVTTDISTNDGAHQVLITGLDNDYNVQTEIVNMNGQNAVYPINPFIAVNAIDVIDTGADGVNKGIIYAGSGTVSSGVPATPYCVIDQAVSRSETMCFTVPRNHVLEIESISVVPKTINTTSLAWKLTKSFLVDTQEVVQTVYTSMYRETQFERIQKFDYPITLNERETLKMSVSQLSSNGDVLAYVVGKLKVIDPNDA
jgi:hypothetical protein